MSGDMHGRGGRTNLGHVEVPCGKGLVAENRPVLVFLAALQHHLEPVAVALQKVWVLHANTAQSSSFNSHNRLHPMAAETWE